MRSLILLWVFVCALVAAAENSPLELPAEVTAGAAFTIRTHGRGEATLYLVGPASVSKRKVNLGTEIKVAGDELEAAGGYLAITCAAQGCSSASFFVAAADPAKISFLLHPSRVPVTARDAINATAFVFDQFHNPVLRPVTVEFRVLPKTGAAFRKAVKTALAVAWIQLSPTPKEGAVKVIAAADDHEEPRVIQQVASEACNLRIKARRTAKGIEVETEPVKDCRGNTVPDGTIVSFTAVDREGKTSVDAPVKKGVARSELPIHGSATISVASGVAIGNEIRL
jgi:hypothetical protein